MTQLPPPNPAAGGAAEAQAAEARRNALQAITDGSLTMDELFAQIEQEEPHHQLGHIHVRALLLALPHIGETKADELLREVGIEASRHLASLGSEQRTVLAENAAVLQHHDINRGVEE